jgi:very-short-patch-repair endonuclease
MYKIFDIKEITHLKTKMTDYEKPAQTYVRKMRAEAAKLRRIQRTTFDIEECLDPLKFNRQCLLKTYNFSLKEKMTVSPQ